MRLFGRLAMVCVGILQVLCCGGTVGNSQADGGSSGPEGGADARLDADVCSVRVSDYDQSCSVDSDCVGVIPGFDNGALAGC